MPAGMPFTDLGCSFMTSLLLIPAQYITLGAVTLTRHARPCAGHPRLGNGDDIKDVDGRDKPGHDDMDQIAAAMASPIACVLAAPPRSGVRCFASAMTFSTPPPIP